jgi:hypothetical protein
MSAATVITNLVGLGVQVKDAWTKSGKDWASFLTSPDFKAIEGSVEQLLASLKPNDLQTALVEVRKKEAAVLNSRNIPQLSLDELTQYHALSDVEHQLVTKLLAAAPNRSGFLEVLVQQVLPALISVAKIVVPLLM